MNKQPLKHQRRGMAVVMILGLLAITMAMSYSMMRSQAINAQIQHNSQRGGHARQAAITGLATALRKIHQDDWEGIDTEFTGWLSTTESYSVSFATGDAALTPGDPDYEMYPYRVTITSVGRVEDLYAHGPRGGTRAGRGPVSRKGRRTAGIR